jgi:formyltetrahydrofolate synthetase
MKIKLLSNVFLMHIYTKSGVFMWDPTKMEDYEIANEALKYMENIEDIAISLGILKEEIIPYGKKMAKIDYIQSMDRLKKNKNGKYIIVTAITPTPLGEGKTTTTIGILDALSKLNKKATAAIRQPSGGPTFNIKGSAAGGGLSQVIPIKELSFGLTGDIDKITNAHNLSMVALTARMQHENNYSDEKLKKLGLKRLDIDENKIFQKWVIDFCAQSLRNITIGQGSKMDGFEMKSGFQISVASELMAILAISKNLKDLKDRISKIVLAKSKSGKNITTRDLKVDGAMSAFMVDTIYPTILQTLEKNPVFVHAGPFANIAIGQSSIIADILALKLSDYHITEAGFASDIGFEKFWNLKCRYSNLSPDAAVIVTTIRALKMHGGGPLVKPGKPLDDVYKKENIHLLKKGVDNLIAHIEIVKKSGVTPVVCINQFSEDTENEIEFIKKISKENGALVAASNHFLKGSKGSIELAKKVIKACDKKNNFKFLYKDDESIEEKIKKIAKKVYGASDVFYEEKALNKLEELKKNDNIKNFGICMVKTHLSLSDNPEMKGRPKNFTLHIKDFLIYHGAKFLVPVAGSIKLMPGTSSTPSYSKIDVDVSSGDIIGLF